MSECEYIGKGQKSKRAKEQEDRGDQVVLLYEVTRKDNEWTNAVFNRGMEGKD